MKETAEKMEQSMIPSVIQGVRNQMKKDSSGKYVKEFLTSCVALGTLTLRDS